MTIEAVLFDYSGVLTSGLQLPTGDVSYDADALFLEMAAVLSATEQHPWHSLERGEISLDAFVEYIEGRVAGAGVLFAADSEQNVMANLPLLDERLALATELKAMGKRLGIVTNNVAEWEPLWRPALPAGLFEIVIDSAAVGCRKPDAAIYELALSMLRIEDAAQVLFIDDFEWNVTGAQAVGLAGIHFTHELDLDAAVMAKLSTRVRAETYS